MYLNKVFKEQVSEFNQKYSGIPLDELILNHEITKNIYRDLFGSYSNEIYTEYEKDKFLRI